MRKLLVGVVLLLSGCNAIFRALSGIPQPDTAAANAFRLHTGCQREPDSIDNVTRGEHDYLRVRGCGQELDCRNPSDDQYRAWKCFPTPESEARQAALEESERRRALEVEQAEADALKAMAGIAAAAAFQKQTDCREPPKGRSYLVRDSVHMMEVTGCDELLVCSVTLAPEKAYCTWPAGVDIAKRRLELETGCAKNTIEPKKSQLLYKGDRIQTYSAYRLDACGKTYVCTVDSERADCKVALDSK